MTEAELKQTVSQHLVRSLHTEIETGHFGTIGTCNEPYSISIEGLRENLSMPPGKISYESTPTGRYNPYLDFSSRMLMRPPAPCTFAGMRVIQDPSLMQQFRFPKSKKKRIRKKFRKNPKNFKPSNEVFIARNMIVVHPQTLKKIAKASEII